MARPREEVPLRQHSRTDRARSQASGQVSGGTAACRSERSGRRAGQSRIVPGGRQARAPSEFTLPQSVTGQLRRAARPRPRALIHDPGTLTEGRGRCDDEKGGVMANLPRAATGRSSCRRRSSSKKVRVRSGSAPGGACGLSVPGDYAQTRITAIARPAAGDESSARQAVTQPAPIGVKTNPAPVAAG